MDFSYGNTIEVYVKYATSSKLVGSFHLVRAKYWDYWLSFYCRFEFGRCLSRSLNDSEWDGTD